ncbi:MAG: serine protease [Pelobacteraceae bacterium]
MNFCRKPVLIVMIAALLAGLTGCGGDSTTVTTINNADLPGFNDITTAPPAIQVAAKAVVRIHTARSSATGFFISSTGQLLTNDHVLGDSVCPIEGCYLEITRMHQRGATLLDPEVVFAVPSAVDVGLDIAVVQLYDRPGGTKLSTPDYLTFNSRNSSSLLGTHVTIVGHPEANLKKWTDGVVANSSGKWFQTTAFVLPGDSGSPVLDDDGRIVGLIHRSPVSLDLFTTNSANVSSICTASAPIMAAMTAPLPSTMISVTAATTTAKFLANDLVYLNAHATSITADGTVTTPLKLLGTACDAALARHDFTSPDDMDEAFTPCYHAQTWIDCRSDAGPVPYGVVCPGDSEAAAWSARYKAVNQRWVDMLGQPDYDSVSFAIAHLQPTVRAGIASGGQALQQAVISAAPVMDLSLAYYLAAFNVTSYGPINIKDYLVNYRTVLHYELNDSYIAYGAGWLYYNNNLTKDELLSLVSRLYTDPTVSLGTRLGIEDLRYEYNAL